MSRIVAIWPFVPDWQTMDLMMLKLNPARNVERVPDIPTFRAARNFSVFAILLESRALFQQVPVRARWHA
jgi:hypothetical protein